MNKAKHTEGIGIPTLEEWKLFNQDEVNNDNCNKSKKKIQIQETCVKF